VNDGSRMERVEEGKPRNRKLARQAEKINSSDKGDFPPRGGLWVEYEDLPGGAEGLIQAPWNIMFTFG
jgi:hypothetical protein